MDYEHWFSRSDDDLAAMDVAELNLLISDGLPGTEAVGLGVLRQRLDDWAHLVAHNTDYWRQRFVPDDDCRTEAEFHMLAMITLLQRHLGVKYNPAQMTGPDNYLDARDHFIHGPLTEHGGTCGSLPILYLAVGRRLGYPLHLVRTIRHGFVRWDDGCERFNIECAGRGFTPRDDEHYRQWPTRFTEKVRTDPFFLRNLSPRQELIDFMGARAYCLMDNMHVRGLLDESVTLFYHLNKHEPKYFHSWAIASMMLQICNGLRFKKSPTTFPFDAAIDLTYRVKPEPWHGNLLEHTREEFQRIAGLHRTRRLEESQRLLESGRFTYLNEKRLVPCTTL